MNTVLFNLFELKFEILTHQNAGQFKNLYNSTYNLWKSVWNNTFKELGTNKTVNGDDFFLLDEFCTLYKHETPIAMVALSWLQMDLLPCQENHYFETYPPETLDKLQKLHYNKVMGLGNLVAHPEWRKENTKVPYTDIVVGLALRRQIEKGYDTSICYTRNNRGVNKLVYRFGGIPLWSNLNRHNVEVDVVVIPSEKVAPHPDDKIEQTIQLIWKTRQNNISTTHKAA